jgi:hypothetical protein
MRGIPKVQFGSPRSASKVAAMSGYVECPETLRSGNSPIVKFLEDACPQTSDVYFTAPCKLAEDSLKGF